MEKDSDASLLFKILKGEVSSLQTYGAFIQLAGLEKQGLVHISQISNSKVDHPSDVLETGESIWCKVISLTDGKVGLSMKLVNQTTGTDLDPANVQLSQDEQKRKAGPRREKAPIQLEAVLDTNCRKCGGSGHIAQDCFYTPGGKKYDLLEEEEKSIFAGPNQLKEKHKKKKDRRKRKSSDSDSQQEAHSSKKRKHLHATVDTERDKHKKRKKRHKHRSGKE